MEMVDGSRKRTYGEMHQRSNRAAGLLRELGISSGDRLAILCRNRIEFFELLFACARVAAILVPLNWRMPSSELRLILEDCGSLWLFHGEEDATTAADLATSGFRTVSLDEQTAQGYEGRLEQAAPVRKQRQWSAQETWFLIYTSGTTGTPKAVIQTFGMALANYVNLSQAMGMRAEDTTLNFLPLFHTAGISIPTLPALMLGSHVLITPGFDLENTVKLIQEESIDTFFGVPAVYQAISLHPEFSSMDLSKIRCWGCGGAPLPDALIRQFAERGATVLNGMGMTETGPTAFLMDAENARRKIGSVGKPHIMTQVRLVGADGKDVAAGQTGEVWYSGLGITPGYYNNPEETRRTIRDGWLRSGDLARQDEDGYYYVVGRLKDMYISGGENVYPAEIENQLTELPGILEAAVIGVTDQKWGEVGCAYLLPRPGQQLPDKAVLTRELKKRLAAYKVPRYFVPVDDFPRTSAGKIQKHLLPAPPIGPQGPGRESTL